MLTQKLKTKIRVLLAEAGLTQRKLASRLRVPDTTLSGWLTGAHPAPVDLSDRIERALDLPTGTLAALLTPPGQAL